MARGYVENGQQCEATTGTGKRCQNNGKPSTSGKVLCGQHREKGKGSGNGKTNSPWRGGYTGRRML